MFKAIAHRCWHNAAYLTNIFCFIVKYVKKSKIFQTKKVIALIVFVSSCLIMIILSDTSSIGTTPGSRNFFKDIDFATWLGLAASLTGAYLAISSQQEGMNEKRYEDFKEYILQNTVDLKEEVSIDLENLSKTQNELEARLWEDLEIVHKDVKDRLAEMVSKLAEQDRMLRANEITIASHKDSFGHDAMIKLLIETRNEVSKLRAEISSISTISEACDRIENLEHLMLKNLASK